MIQLPAQYAWLAKEPGPKLLIEALKLFGTQEIVGPAHNPEILSWAKECGLDSVYKQDEIPWCGLFIAVVAKRAGKPVVKDPLWAANWLKYGVPCEPELGAIAVFSRDGGNHVCIIVGEDTTHLHCLGGNQKNSVCITRIAKNRLRGCRALYRNKPANVRKVILSSTGEVSTNES